MKQISFLFATLFCAVLFGGCPASTTDPEVTPTPAASQLKCKIAGVQFTSNAASASIQAGRLVIVASEAGSTKNIILQADESVAQVKTYDFLGGGINVGIYNPGGGAAAFASNAAGTSGSNNGNFKVTSVDATAKTMSGTFLFTAVGGVSGNTVAVTEGTFTNIPYVLNPTTGNSNVFSFTVNGTAPTITAKSGMLLGGQLAISGSATQTNSYKGVNIFLSPTVAVGVINATAGFGTFGYQEGPSPASAVIYQPVTGNTVTITEHNTTTKRIKGSFNCLNMTTTTAGGGTRSLVGNFDVTYQ
jgi:Family of unknown function (DUF6252)